MFNLSIIGGSKVKGKYKPKRKNTFATLIGDHKLDLRKAELPADTPIKITLCTLVGNAKVIVRPDTAVDIGGIALIGRKKTDVKPETEPAQSHLRISFNCLIGNLEVTSKGDKH